MSAVTTGLVEPNRTDVVCVMGMEALAHWFKEHFQPQISDLVSKRTDHCDVCQCVCALMNAR